MRPSQFNFAQPKSLHEAALLAQKGATLLGGGQALIQALRLRTVRPSEVVDLKCVSELSREITETEGGIRIGALVTVTNLFESRLVAKQLPMLREAASRLGDVQVRNRATVVGNVCWADPRANLAVALLAYGAVLRVHNGQSERLLAVADCFAGFRSLVLKPGEIVVAIDVPTTEPVVAADYLEFSRQRNDLALVNIAAVRRRAIDYCIAAGGLAQTPLRLTSVERLLAIAKSLPAIEAFANAIRESPVAPLGDPYGSLDYKIHLGAVLLSRIVSKLNDGVAHVAG
jgi:carbon-monoxide dehydrogenase medium subunit